MTWLALLWLGCSGGKESVIPQQGTYVLASDGPYEGTCDADNFAAPADLDGLKIKVSHTGEGFDISYRSFGHVQLACEVDEDRFDCPSDPESDALLTEEHFEGDDNRVFGAMSASGKVESKTMFSLRLTADVQCDGGAAWCDREGRSYRLAFPCTEIYTFQSTKL